MSSRHVIAVVQVSCHVSSHVANCVIVHVFKTIRVGSHVARHVSCEVARHVGSHVARHVGIQVARHVGIQVASKSAAMSHQSVAIRDDFILSLLMVKICQPSHEFTFGVGMTFVSYPLVLTPVV
jgi:hypothetical protein